MDTDGSVTDSSVDRVRKNLQKEKSRLVSTQSDENEDEGDNYGKRLFSEERKRSDLGSFSDSETTLKVQVRRLTEKLKDMEASRKWNLKSNEMQDLYQVKVRQLWVEDCRDALEEHFGEKRKNFF